MGTTPGPPKHSCQGATGGRRARCWHHLQPVPRLQLDSYRPLAWGLSLSFGVSL